MKRKNHSSGRGGGRDDKKPKTAREEINEILESVKEFNAKALEGGKKAAHMDDKLTKLGALPPKKQKIPYAMRLGLNAAKKKREHKEAQIAKESQVQLPQSYTQNKKRKK